MTISPSFKVVRGAALETAEHRLVGIGTFL
jgi:hypothetical protein